jgi:hypothetical protein
MPDTVTARGRCANAYRDSTNEPLPGHGEVRSGPGTAPTAQYVQHDAALRLVHYSFLAPA